MLKDAKTVDTLAEFFVQGMQEIGYEGYLGYELCHPLPPIDGKPAGLDFADVAGG